MKLLHRLPFALILLLTSARSAPLPEGAYVDFIVIPVGPIPLAEFVMESQPAGEATPDDGKGSVAPDGPGSGVRIKEIDPREVPPDAVYLKQGEDRYLRIPCHQNSVGVPVRTPVKDSELTFLLRDPDGSESFTPLEKSILPGTNRVILVLLTKPLKEKDWTSPLVTLVPIPNSSAAQAFFANASQTQRCGVVVNNDQKLLLTPLKSSAWRPATGSNATLATVAMAMGQADGTFNSPFFDDTLELKPGTTQLILCYDVTPQESFRGAKTITGILTANEFRPAQPWPDKPETPRAR
jgi:hypothetical protein